MRDVIELFTFTSIGFGLMLSFKLLTLKKHGLIVMWLGFYVLLLVGSLCEVFFRETQLIMIGIGTTYWLFGPCLYLYVYERVSKKQLQFFRDCAIHLLPFVTYVLFVVATALAGARIQNEIVDFLLYEVVFAHIIVYFLKALTLIRKHPATQRQTSVERMQRASMLFLVIASLAIFGSSWLSTHLFVLIGMKQGEIYTMLVQGIISLLIFAIALLNTETRYTERMKML